MVLNQVPEVVLGHTDKLQRIRELIGCRHASAVSCLRRGRVGLPDPERVSKGGGGQVKGEQTGDQLAREVPAEPLAKREAGQPSDQTQRYFSRGFPKPPGYSSGKHHADPIPHSWLGQIDRRKTALDFVFSRGVQKVESIMISSAVNQLPCKLLHIATLYTNDIANWCWFTQSSKCVQCTICICVRICLCDSEVLTCNEIPGQHNKCDKQGERVIDSRIQLV
ncbi:uncharacterized protein LOC119803256 [Arvicola amphibius]|uniref:uncharacterized protein LOC119803256 n=1 Tax=Arvicola amphibius TaxID=1047088 RepID=UPI001C089E95|nr:uncharacterized protein LOC119803256 [Arvicola amphibius]